MDVKQNIRSHIFGEMSPKKSESSSVQYLQQYRKVTKFHFFITIVGFQAVRHYQAIEQCYYFVISYVEWVFK